MRGAWRAAYDGSAFDYDGELYSVEGYERTLRQQRERVPIFLAAVQSGMCALAGEIADGVLFNVLSTPRYVREYALPHIERGAARAGRTAGDVERGSAIAAHDAGSGHGFAAKKCPEHAASRSLSVGKCR